MDKQRNRTIFYLSFYEAIEKSEDVFTDDDCLALYRAIFKYAFYGETPTFNGAKKMAWKLIEPNLAADRQRFLNGINGGAPKGNTNAKKQPRNNRETTDPIKEREIEDREKENEENEIIEKSDKKKSSSKKFIKPTLDEIKAYIEEKSLEVDAERFLDYYESIGWKVGRNSMKDWKATLRNWNRKDNNGTGSGMKSKHEPRFTH